MKQQPEALGNLDVALAAAAIGYVPIPVLPGSKVPAVKWKRWQTEMPPPALIRAWFADARRNIALITSGLVLFDCDDPAKADLVIAQCGQTPYAVRTPRGGVHLGFRRRNGLVLQNQVRIKGLPIDIRTDGGLALIPPSRTEDGAYAWLSDGLRAASAYQVARIGWTRTKMRKRVVQNIEVGDLDFLEMRATRWLQRIEGARSGQNGHGKTFRVACRLTHLPPVGFGLEFEAALRLMLRVFNPQCEPEWTEKELAHKVRDAIKKRR